MGDFPTWQQLGFTNEPKKKRVLKRTLNNELPPEPITMEHYEPGSKFWTHGSLEEGCYDL